MQSKQQQQQLQSLQRMLFVVGPVLGFVLLQRFYDGAELWQPLSRQLVPQRPSSLGTGPLPQGSWEESTHRIWTVSGISSLTRLKCIQPVRFLHLLRPQLDLLLLPGTNGRVCEVTDFYIKTLGLDPEQVIFTPAANDSMNVAVDTAVMHKIQSWIKQHPGKKHMLVPLGNSGTDLLNWSAPLVSELGVTYFAEDPAWMAFYGNKGMLHRAMSALDKPSIIERIAPHVTVPHGYYAENHNELMEAYRLLGGHRAVIKPVSTAGGAGVVFVEQPGQVSEYDFPQGPVVVQEMLQLESAPDGSGMSPAVHFIGTELNLPLHVDQMMEGPSWSGWRTSAAGAEFWQTALNHTRHLLEAMQPQAAGGFDYVSSRGRVYIIDVNTGRFNGAHYWKLFQQRYAPEAASIVWKEMPPEGTTIWQFWGCLQDKGLAFTPGDSRTGVFPIRYMQGCTAMFIAMADTDQEAEAMKPHVKACLAGAVATEL